MTAARIVALAGLLPLLCGSAEAQRRHTKTTKTTRQHSSTLAQRRRLNVDSLITEPGTVETEWYGVFWTDGTFAAPTTWKVTPGREGGFWARTELSASFDLATVHEADSGDVAHSSDHLTFASTTVLPGWGPLQLAVAPTATFWLRGDTGARVGATFYGKAEGERHQGGFVLNWTGATSPSTTNPAGTFDGSVAYGYRLGREGLPGKLTAHGSAQWERSTGVAWLANLSEGIEYDVTEKLSLDLSAQQLNLHTGSIDNQIILGVTWNLGRIRKH